MDRGAHGAMKSGGNAGMRCGDRGHTQRGKGKGCCSNDVYVQRMCTKGKAGTAAEVMCVDTEWGERKAAVCGQRETRGEGERRHCRDRVCRLKRERQLCVDRGKQGAKESGDTAGIVCIDSREKAAVCG